MKQTIDQCWGLTFCFLSISIGVRWATGIILYFLLIFGIYLWCLVLLSQAFCINFLRDLLFDRPFLRKIASFLLVIFSIWLNARFIILIIGCLIHYFFNASSSFLDNLIVHFGSAIVVVFDSLKKQYCYFDESINLFFALERRQVRIPAPGMS